MNIRYGLVVAWALATLTSILVAFAAVGSVRTAITDPPSALLLPQGASQERTEPTLPELQQSTVPDPDLADRVPAEAASSDSTDRVTQDSGSVPVADEAQPETTEPPTTAPPQPTEPSSTTAPPTSTSSTTSTTAPATDSLETYETEGGWVTVRSTTSGAYLESASPKPGWTVETEGRGPEHFTVVFKGDDDEIHFKVEFENGEVGVEIED